MEDNGRSGQGRGSGNLELGGEDDDEGETDDFGEKVDESVQVTTSLFFNSGA